MSKQSNSRTGTTGALIGLAVALGAVAGIGGYTFRYAEGLSYLQTDPRACVNCHIMQQEYDGWQKASHHTAAVCVDCHLPSAFIPKYLTKAENGWRHGKMFTLQNFHEPIAVGKPGLEILQENCERCHGELTASIAGPHGHGKSAESDTSFPCIKCHAGVGHGERAGLGGPITQLESEEKLHTPGAL